MKKMTTIIKKFALPSLAAFSLLGGNLFANEEESKQEKKKVEVKETLVKKVEQPTPTPDTQQTSKQ